MKNFPSIIYVENQNTHFVFNIFFFSENRALFEIMSRNMVQSEAQHVTM